MASGLLYFEGEVCRRQGRVQVAGSGDEFRRFDGAIEVRWDAVAALSPFEEDL